MNTWKRIFVVVVSAAVLWPVPASAWNTPKCLEGGRIIGAEQLEELIAKGTVKVFDARKKVSYAENHLPTAAGVAAAYDHAVKRLDSSVLGTDKSAPIVIYSHGIDGWKSYFAARSAIEAGFTNVIWFRGGFATWLTKGYPLEN